MDKSSKFPGFLNTPLAAEIAFLQVSLQLFCSKQVARSCCRLETASVRRTTSFLFCAIGSNVARQTTDTMAVKSDTVDVLPVNLNAIEASFLPGLGHWKVITVLKSPASGSFSATWQIQLQHIADRVALTLDIPGH